MVKHDLPSIGIVGGGAASALFLAHFVSKHTAPVKVVVYDRTGQYAQGVAYSTRRAEHLLNVRAKGMSALDHEPQHFLRWLEKNGLPYQAGDFVPRKIYGTYLSGLFQQSAEQIKVNGGTISFKTENVTGISAGVHGNYSITTGNTTTSADIVIIATGNASPILPEGAQNLKAKDGYFSDPWQANYAEIAKENDIIILGTGLSMVDAVLSLHQNKFNGKVKAISRHGLLPQTHTDTPEWPNFFEGNIPATALQALKITKEQIATAKREKVPWQAVIDGIRPMTNTIWEAWSVREKRKFLRLLPYWNIHRHRMAPQASAIIYQFMQSGRLQIVRDKIDRVNRARDKLGAVGADLTYEASVMINCLGYRRERDALQIFSETNVQGVQQNLYALGPSLFGRYLETTAIPEIRMQAAKIAEQIDNFLAVKRAAIQG